jgi:folate-binding protein YgfZ
MDMTDSDTRTANWLASIDDLPQPLLVPLDHQSLLRVSGPDAEKFLQGQTTADFRRLAESRLLLGAHCDHKGRMHSSFIAAKLDQTTIGLRVHAGIAEHAQAALQKYIVFSKAQLAPATDVRMLGLIGKDVEHHLQNAVEVLPTADGEFSMQENITVLRHSIDCFELWIQQPQAETVERALSAHFKPATSNEWDLHQIRHGLGQVRSETKGEFIPQVLNFQHLGGISFNKGCYTGQEVVARMHYLGKTKRHTYLGLVRAPELPAPGTPVFTANKESPSGEVVMAAFAGENLVAQLFVCSEQSVDEGALALKSPTGPNIELLPLPYSLD